MEHNGAYFYIYVCVADLMVEVIGSSLCIFSCTIFVVFWFSDEGGNQSVSGCIQQQ